MPLEIAEDLFLVEGPGKGRFPFSHSVLAAGERNVLFDTGCGGAALKALEESFDIDLVVNSHTHPDHFSGNGHIAGHELIVPEMFAGILADLEKMSLRLAGGGQASEQWLFMVTRLLEHVPTAPTGTYRDGDIIDTGALRFEAVHTPGHTADHFCFFESRRRILLSFDFDLTAFGPWYGHAESDLEALLDSLAKVREMEPAMVVSSHREPVTQNIEEQFRAYEDVVHRRDEVLLGFIGKDPVTPEAIADSSPIYELERGQSFALYHYFESRMVEKHLGLLEKKGIVESAGPGLFKRA